MPGAVADVIAADVIIPVRGAVVVTGQRVQDDLRPVVRALDLPVGVIQVPDSGAVGQDFIKVGIREDTAALGGGGEHLQQPVVIQIGKGIVPVRRVFALVKGPEAAVFLQNTPLFLLRQHGRSARLGRFCFSRSYVDLNRAGRSLKTGGSEIIQPGGHGSRRAVGADKICRKDRRAVHLGKHVDVLAARASDDLHSDRAFRQVCRDLDLLSVRDVKRPDHKECVPVGIPGRDRHMLPVVFAQSEFRLPACCERQHQRQNHDQYDAFVFHKLFSLRKDYLLPCFIRVGL